MPFKDKTKRQQYQLEWYHTHKSQRNEYDRKRSKTEHRKSQIRNYKETNSNKVVQWTINRYKRLGVTLNLSYKDVMIALVGWSKSIKKRCNNLCQICGSPADHSHHIIPKSKYPQLSLNLNNGIALCLKHHNEVHGRFE